MKKTVLIALCLAAAGCKNPFDRTRDASGGGGTGAISASSNLIVFYNELATGGGAFEYPGPDGQSLSFSDASNPIGHRSIRYSWTGQLVTNTGCPAQSPSPFAGFDLQHAINLSDYASQGRNLQATGVGYTKVTFYARGSLSSKTVLKIEVASPGSPADACVAAPSPCLTLLSPNPGPTDADVCTGSLPVQTLNSSWSQYTITVSKAQLANVRDFFKATFVFAPGPGAPAGQGGTVYFDKIQYEP